MLEYQVSSMESDHALPSEQFLSSLLVLLPKSSSLRGEWSGIELLKPLESFLSAGEGFSLHLG